MLLLSSCNIQKAPTPPQEFTYTHPEKLINAVKAIIGYEDSHHVPNHDSLGHDHSTAESWTNEKAVSELSQIAGEYKKQNPTFEMIVGNCLIPGYQFHSYSMNEGLKHFSEHTNAEAIKAFKDVKETGWVLVFKDRLIIVSWNNRIKEKRLSL